MESKSPETYASQGFLVPVTGLEPVHPCVESKSPETYASQGFLVPVTGLEPVHPCGYGILSLCRHLERRGYLSALLEPCAPKNPAKSRVSAVGTAQSTVAKGKTQRGCIYKISASWRDIRRDMNRLPTPLTHVIIRQITPPSESDLTRRRHPGIWGAACRIRRMNEAR